MTEVDRLNVIEHSADYERGALDALDYITDERPDLEDLTMRIAEKIGADILTGHRHHQGAVSAMREAAELLEESGTPEYVNPPTAGAMQRVAAELRTHVGGQSAEAAPTVPGPEAISTSSTRSTRRSTRRRARGSRGMPDHSNARVSAAGAMRLARQHDPDISWGELAEIAFQYAPTAAPEGDPERDDSAADLTAARDLVAAVLSTIGGGRGDQLREAITKIDNARAELEALRDVAARMIGFDGGAMLMSWVNAHRRHQDHPYIGCLFCRDQFVRKPKVSVIGDLHSGGIDINGHDVGLNGIDKPEALEIANKIRTALDA